MNNKGNEPTPYQQGAEERSWEQRFQDIRQEPKQLCSQSLTTQKGSCSPGAPVAQFWRAQRHNSPRAQWPRLQSIIVQGRTSSHGAM